MLDARRFHIHEAAGDTSAGLEASARRQGRWLTRRQGFEDLWRHGRSFVYGALNAGGMGTEGRFGPFCLLLGEPDLTAPNAPVCFPGDSAQRYTTDSGAIDEASAHAEATEWAGRADMAVVIRADEALREPDSRWPSVVCRSDQCMEVVRPGPVPLAEAATVRLRPSYRSRLDELQASALAGEALAADETNEAGAYDVLLRWARSDGLVLEDVPEPEGS